MCAVKIVSSYKVRENCGRKVIFSGVVLPRISEVVHHDKLKGATLRNSSVRFIYNSAYNNITMETITIPKVEYERLKKLEELDLDLIRQFAGSLEDLKEGRFKRLA